MINRLSNRIMVVLLAIVITLVALYYTSNKVISPVISDKGAASTISPLTGTATVMAAAQPSVPTAKAQPTAQTLLSPLQSPPISATTPSAAMTQNISATTPVTDVTVYTYTLYTYKVVKTYPHDPQAFTEGLLFDNGSLYESTGINGKSWLRKVDLATGKVIKQVDLPAQYFGEGISIVGDKIFQLTWQSHIGFIYNKSTFALLQTFAYPTEGWGMTKDDKQLIMSDGTARLTLRNPTTFAEIGHIDVHDANGPVTQLNELEYVHDKIYANIWMTNRIAIISPQTGQITGWIDLTDLLPPADRAGVDVLNGIAYLPDKDQLFVTGKQWPKLFEIRLVPKS